MSKFLIYALHHPDSLHVYVGKSSVGLLRPRSHGSECNLKKNAKYPVVRWIKKRRSLGQEYQIIVLEELNRAEQLDEAERFYIAYFRSIGMSLLNLTDGGGGFSGGKQTEEARRKISEKQRLKWTPERKARAREIASSISEDTRAKISAALKGRTFSEEHRRRMSESRKGKPLPQWISNKGADAVRGKKWTPEHVAKISASLTGRVLSEESRAKIARSLTGRKATPEARYKQSVSRTGRKHTAETLLKMSAAQKGRTFSIETRAKMSAAQKAKAPPSVEARRNMSIAAQRRRRPRLRVNLLSNG